MYETDIEVFKKMLKSKGIVEAFLAYITSVAPQMCQFKDDKFYIIENVEGKLYKYLATPKMLTIIFDSVETGFFQLKGFGELYEDGSSRTIFDSTFPSFLSDLPNRGLFQ